MLLPLRKKIEQIRDTFAGRCPMMTSSFITATACISVSWIQRFSPTGEAFTNNSIPNISINMITSHVTHTFKICHHVYDHVTRLIITEVCFIWRMCIDRGTGLQATAC